MPGFNLYTSNRLEVLAEKMADVLRSPLASPLQKEIVLVQSKGMARWVSMELERHNGICSNCWFPFPNHFVYAPPRPQSNQATSLHSTHTPIQSPSQIRFLTKLLWSTPE